MPRKLRYFVFIIIGMGISLIISSYLLQTLFIQQNPTPFWSSFSEEMTELKENTLLAQSSASFYVRHATTSFISFAQPTPLPTVEITPPQQSNYAFFFDRLPAPTAPQAPIVPIIIPSVTMVPTQYIIPTTIPTIHINIPTRVLRPTSRPTTKPTPTRSPTKAPKPTISLPFSKVVGDPLKQMWYGNGSLACYTTERFIEVYANSLKPNACYSNIRAYMDTNKVSMTLLGKTIEVHKKALPAFEAVSKALDQYKVDDSTYEFPSKTYIIKNVGAYVFRCNVNASTSGKTDTCSDGCKLSTHAFGISVDINYEENCNGCTTYDMPKEISDTFEMYGFRWGGHYPLINSYIDPMHFEYMKDLCEGL